MRNLLWSGFLMLLLSGCGWNGTASRQNTLTPLTAITVTADYSTIAPGTSVKLKAMGNFSGYFTRDISDQVAWTSDTPGVAAFVTAAGPNRVTGQAPGSAVLTATMKGVSATFTLTVSSATPTAVTITPVAPSVALGLSEPFTATGAFSDGTTQDITFDAAWTSSNTTVATVSYSDANNKETAATLAAGTTTITAAFGGVSGTTSLTVTEPQLQSIAVTAPATTVLSLSRVALTATGSYTDGTTRDLTGQVAWASSNTSAVPVPTSAGVTTTAAPGTATITASLTSAVVGSVSGSTTLTVTGGTLAGFPALTNMTVVKGTSVPLGVTGTFSGAVTRDITGGLTWKIANPAFANVTTVSPNRLLIRGVATGTTTITATAPGPSGQAQTSSAFLTVTAPGLHDFTVSPTSFDLTAGTSGRLVATAHYSDGTSQDVSNNVSLISANTAVAAVGAAGPAGVRINGQGAGATTLTATFGGQTFTAAPITVTARARNLQKITINTPASLAVGSPATFTVTAAYSDGTTADVTGDAAWSIDDPAIAVLPDSQSQPGQVIGVSSGTTTLRVGFNSVTAFVTIKVP